MNDLQRVGTASPERTADLLGHGVSATLVEKLTGAPRLQGRLAALLVSRLGDLGRLDDRQVSVLAMTPDALRELAVRAGAVWNAGAVARIIDGATRRALTARLGDDAYGLALSGRRLAPPDGPVDLTFAAIADAAPIEGAACLAAWCDIQPSPIAARLTLVGPKAAPMAGHRTWGPAIIDWLLDRQ